MDKAAIEKELKDYFVAFGQKEIQLKNQIEKAERAQYEQLKDFAVGLIEMIDGLDRKIERQNNKEEEEESKEARKALKTLINMRKKMLRLLDRFGIRPIVFPDNQLIESYAKVLGSEPSRDHQDREILRIILPGYMQASQIIRQAEVIVVKN